MTHSSEPEWRLSDEWFAAFIEELEASPRRRTRVKREAIKPLPITETLAIAFAEKTEQLRRYLAAERERWLAESRTAS